MAESDSPKSSPVPNHPTSRCLVCKNFKRFTVHLDKARETAGSGCVRCAILISAAGEAEQRKVDQGNSQGTSKTSPVLLVSHDDGPTLSFRINDRKTPKFNISTTTTANLRRQVMSVERNKMPANTVKRFCLRENADLILKWSKACSSSHSKCRQSSAPLPTRIIDVGCLPEDIPRLCSGENRSDPYCALSHCWGSSQPLRTTKATLHEGESGIAWHLLPQTFQDAMIVTRRLSIRYLWIDSLCIIQDDELDWQRESTRMAFIYGNAYLVISATHAAQGSTGCFSERLPQMLCYIHKTSNNDEIPIYVEPASEIHSSFESLSIHSKLSPQLPLLSRSWCFQERLLATRVLHFAGDDLIWECRSKTLCECTGLDPQKSMKSIQGSFVDERHSYALWHKLLKVYMSRQKTYPSDRLPAISGIAQQMQHAGLGDYVFGIWKENLFEDLLWTPNLAQTVDRCQAPSWSWACLHDPTKLSYIVQTDDGPESLLDHINLRQKNSPGLDSEGKPFTTALVELPRLHSIRNAFAATLRGLEDLEELEELAELMQLEELESGPVVEDPTGEVISPALTISAPLVTVSITPPRIPGGTSRKCWRVRRDDLELEFRHDCRTDFVNYDKANIDGVCIWIGTIWPTTKNEFSCPQLMVLRKSIGIGGRAATLGAYERVGIITSYGRSDRLTNKPLSTIMGWFEEAKVMEVTIV